MRIALRLAFAAALLALSSTAASAQSSDHRIVPGQRIGSIRIGMLMDEVTAALGQPSKKYQDDGGAQYIYDSGGRLYVVFTGRIAPRVVGVTTESPSYVTDKGIRVGSSVFDAARAYGETFKDMEGISMRYDSLGMFFSVQGGKIIQVGVQKVSN
jgi:hypothetical protein